MDLQIKGRKAVVTGATAGIGREIALALATEGASLAIVGRRLELLEGLAQEARCLGAQQVELLAQDMMDADSAQIIANKALAALGNVDILINCMGASRPITVDASEQDWDEAFMLNWARHRQLTTALLPGMRRNVWGRIVNITGPNESSGINAAGVAKSALHAWAKQVSDVVAIDGITINSIGPGKINSEQMARRYSAEQREAFSKSQIPAGRFGEPRELADLAVFLASGRASYITGSVIHVDGGLHRYMF